MTGRKSKVALALLIATTAMGCAVYSAADWNTVSQQWGGMRIDEPRLEGRRVLLPLEVGLHPATGTDSAICLNGASAKTRQQTIYVSLKKGLCSSISRRTPWQIALSRPKPGSYQIVYDDAAAGFPVIGALQVPPR